jgi:hypothetical protein
MQCVAIKRRLAFHAVAVRRVAHGISTVDIRPRILQAAPAVRRPCILLQVHVIFDKLRSLLGDGRATSKQHPQGQ